MFTHPKYHDDSWTKITSILYSSGHPWFRAVCYLEQHHRGIISMDTSVLHPEGFTTGYAFVERLAHDVGLGI